MQDVGDALSRREALREYQEGEPDAVVQRHPVGGIEATGPVEVECVGSDGDLSA